MELTLDQITSLLSDTRKRGVYEPVISEFVESGEVYLDFSARTEFAKMDANAVRNSINNNLKKDAFKGLNLTVVIDRSDKDNPHVILVNVDALAAAQAAA